MKEGTIIKYIIVLVFLVGLELCNETKSIAKIARDVEAHYNDRNYTESLLIIQEFLSDAINREEYILDRESKKFLGNITNVLGKLYFFNFIERREYTPQESFLLFTLASKLGSGESYFYLSLMTFFKLDDFSEKHLNFSNAKSLDMDLFLSTRAERLSSLYLYMGSLHGDRKSMIAQAFRFSKGIMDSKNCINAITYIKDIAFETATDDNSIPRLIRREYLDKEVYNMKIDLLNQETKNNNNDDVLAYVTMQAQNGEPRYQMRLGSM